MCACVCVAFFNLRFYQGKGSFTPLFEIFNCRGFLNVRNVNADNPSLSPLSDKASPIHYPRI